LQGMPRRPVPTSDIASGDIAARTKYTGYIEIPAGRQRKRPYFPRDAVAEWRPVDTIPVCYVVGLRLPCKRKLSSHEKSTGRVWLECVDGSIDSFQHRTEDLPCFLGRIPPVQELSGISPRWIQEIYMPHQQTSGFIDCQRVSAALGTRGLNETPLRAAKRC